MQPLKLKKPLLLLGGVSLALGLMTVAMSFRSAESATVAQTTLEAKCVPATFRHLQPGTELYDSDCNEQIATVKATPNRQQSVVIETPAPNGESEQTAYPVEQFVPPQTQTQFYVRQVS